MDCAWGLAFKVVNDVLIVWAGHCNLYLNGSENGIVPSPWFEPFQLYKSNIVQRFPTCSASAALGSITAVWTPRHRVDPDSEQ